MLKVFPVTGKTLYSVYKIPVKFPVTPVSICSVACLNGAPCLTQLDCTCDVPPPEMGQNLATCPQTIHESLSPSTMRDSQWWDKKPHILGLPKEI